MLMHRQMAVREAALAQGSGTLGPNVKATTAAVGDCLVTSRWLGFHRIWHGSGEVFDTVDLFLPDVQFTTQVRKPSGTLVGLSSMMDITAVLLCKLTLSACVSCLQLPAAPEALIVSLCPVLLMR